MSFKRLDLEDVTISAESVVAPIWSTGTPVLTQFFTSSAQAASNAGNFYYEIFQTSSLLDTAETQFSVTFGHRLGSGSANFDTNTTGNVDGKSASSVIYGQYRTLIYGDENRNFTFGTATEIDHIYAISLDRARYKEKILPGSFNLKLTKGGASLDLTDDSKVQTTVSYTDAGRVFQLISGSNGAPFNPSSNGYTASSGSYGLVLPDIGVVILNGKALDLSSGNRGIALASTLTSATSTVGSPNISKIYDAIRAGQRFQCRSEETVTSNFIFVRARNAEFNYTTNPSNIDSSGELVHDVMVNTPQSYITTIGLYNDSNDLVAVAKLSRPLLKDFTKEALLRVKLNF
jgi:hypothetical protein